MSLVWAIGLFVLGLVIVIAAAERLVESTVGVSRGIGVSAFLLSVVFIGFDPENLAVGVAATVEGSAGIALGTIIGAAMVAVALALGVTALVVPLRFEAVPHRLLVVPVGVLALVSGLALDGQLSRFDGGLLLLAYVGAVVALIYWERQGIHVLSSMAVEEDETGPSSSWHSVAWFVVSLVGVVMGSEVLLRGARPVIETLGWTDTTFGMTVLAFLVSVEEVARELPAALKGRPEISIGNVLGSVLAFLAFNAGAIALVRPVPVDDVTQQFYLPVCAITVIFVVALLAVRRVPRWAGAVLVLLYILFVAGPMGI